MSSKRTPTCRCSIPLDVSAAPAERRKSELLSKGDSISTCWLRPRTDSKPSKKSSSKKPRNTRAIPAGVQLRRQFCRTQCRHRTQCHHHERRGRACIREEWNRLKCNRL